jgi:hypothetical protein
MGSANGSQFVEFLRLTLDTHCAEIAHENPCKAQKNYDYVSKNRTVGGIREH